MIARRWPRRRAGDGRADHWSGCAGAGTPLGRIRKIRERVRLSILLVTHDIGVIAETANRVGVMYAGQIVECALTIPLSRNHLIRTRSGSECVPEFWRWSELISILVAPDLKPTSRMRFC
jgi:hypothetical protein